MFLFSFLKHHYLTLFRTPGNSTFEKWENEIVEVIEMSRKTEKCEG